MAENKLSIPIKLSNGTIFLILFGESNDEILLNLNDAEENGESPFQIIEGCSYEYKLPKGYSLHGYKDIISQSKVHKFSGRITPNIYVGTLVINVLDSEQNKCGELKLEVQSKKITYREDYRLMLEEITEKCTDLLLQHSSPVSQYFEVNFNFDAQTLYQRFAFVKSILESDEFNDSLHKIISAPVTRWKDNEEKKDIRNVRKFTNSSIRQLAGATNRIELTKNHQLFKRMKSVPEKIRINNKTETVDTPENRFIKFVLISFQSFFSDLKEKTKNNGRIFAEAGILENKIQEYLNHSVFKEISKPKTLPLNSPVLQRKEGYREVLRVWLMFDLAAKLVWHGGEDVYSGNKRDVAVLYEYWLFFKLLDIVSEIFSIEQGSVKDLIKKTTDGLGLQLKQGKHTAVKGIFDAGTRKLNVKFSYNKTFQGEMNYPYGGSWTKKMRPDYTLSIWPFGITQAVAENEELITHIHFDAKYKVENITGIIGTDEDFIKEKEDQRKGTFKRIDLLKMHAYKDAIRRTAGSYILYPGTENPYKKNGFHELIPGLGAFSVRPSKTNTGSEALTVFIKDVVQQLLNRASQKEKIAYKTYETFKDKPFDIVNQSLPETINSDRSLIPDETYILIGYYDKEKWKWIYEKGWYNARAGSRRGSINVSPKVAGAKFILLHSEGELITDKILEITVSGPQVWSKETLISKGYPSKSNDNYYYLVYKTEPVKRIELFGKKWDISKLEGYKSDRGSGFPFAVSLTELMKVKV